VRRAPRRPHEGSPPGEAGTTARPRWERRHSSYRPEAAEGLHGEEALQEPPVEGEANHHEPRLGRQEGDPPPGRGTGSGGTASRFLNTEPAPSDLRSSDLQSHGPPGRQASAARPPRPVVRLKVLADQCPLRTGRRGGIVPDMKHAKVGGVSRHVGRHRVGPFLLGCALATGVLVGRAPKIAQAASCTSHVFVNAYQIDAEHRGILLNNYTGGPQSTTCFRVSSSLLIHNFGSTQVEIGWIIDTAQFSSCAIASSSRDPWLFRFYITNGGLGHCTYYNSPRPVSGNFYSYKIVRDDTFTDEFHTWFNGSEVGSVIDMTAGGMSYGWATTNAERYYNYDSAYGNWEALQYKDNTGWHNWNLDGDCYDSDNGFDNALGVGGSATHIEVNPGSGPNYNNTPC